MEKQKPKCNCDLCFKREHGELQWWALKGRKTWAPEVRKYHIYRHHFRLGCPVAILAVAMMCGYCPHDIVRLEEELQAELIGQGCGI